MSSSRSSSDPVEVVTGRIAVGDVELAVDQAGAGGRPLLLVHGFCGCRQDFAPVIPALVAAGWHAVAADNRGHGDSDQPPDEGAYGLDRFTADAAALVDALGWERFALVGHSLGGAIAQQVALTAPERIAALVLMNTTPGALDIDPALLAASAAVVRGEGLDRLVELMKERADPLGSPAHERAAAQIPGYGERGERNTRRCSPAMYARMMEELGSMPDRSVALAGWRAPTLVIVGEEDRLMLAPSRRLADVIPGARLAVIADAGHNPLWENTEESAAALLGFLVGVSASFP
jgi:3-oxoadipate enol-lactonase